MSDNYDEDGIFEEEDENKSSETIVFELIRDYAVDIATRKNPTASKKRYQKFVWDAFTLEDMLNYELTAVFNSEEDAKRIRDGAPVTGTKVKDHLKYVFDALSQKIVGTENEDGILFAKYLLSTKIMVSTETQTIYDKIDQAVDTCNL